MILLKNGFLRLFFLLSSPIWIIQGLIFKRIALRLPEAKRKNIFENKTDTVTHDFLMLGDSVAAGVGIAHIQDALAGEIANQLAVYNKDVSWQVFGQSGFKINDLINYLSQNQLPRTKQYVISIGVNDVKGFTTYKDWRSNLERLILLLQQINPTAQIILLEIPAMEKFPLLKVPLSIVLGYRSKTLSNISAEIANENSFVTLLPVEVSDDASHFAEDGFHPSNKACKLIAPQIINCFKGR